MRKRLRALFRYPNIFLIAVPAVLYGPILVSGKTVFWGTQITQFVPWWTQAVNTLRAGELPLWNPLNGMGAPLLANYQSALLYPPTWLVLGLGLVLGTAALAWGQALLIMLHLMWAGLGMAALVKRLGWGELPQLVSGLAFGMSGYLVARSHFLTINFAVSWLPWILLATYQLVKSKRTNYVILKLGLILGLQLLAGHAQITWYSILLAIAWMLFWAWLTDRWNAIKRSSIHFVAAVFAGISLAAVQLLPTAEYLLQSQRSAAVDFDTAMIYSFWPWRIVTLFVPNMFGSPAAGDYQGYATYWEDAIYIGLLPVILAVLAIMSRRKKRVETNLVWFAAVAILVGSLFALGDNTPIFPWLYRNMPTFDMFQAPTRYSIWAVFSLALLAGMGAKLWRRPESRGWYWSRLGVMAAVSVSLSAGLGWWLSSTGNIAFGDIRPTFIPAVALAGIWGLLAGILNLTVPKSWDAPAAIPWKWLLGLVLALDLLVVSWGLNPGTSLELFMESPSNLNEVQELSEGRRVYISPEEERLLKFERFFSFETFELEEEWINLRAALLPNTNLLEGIASANNFDPLIPGNYDRWMNALDEAPSNIKSEMLGRMNVGLVEHTDPTFPYGVRFDYIDNGARARWLPCEFRTKDSESALNAVLSGNVDMLTTVIIASIQSDSNRCVIGQKADISIISESSNRVELEIDAPTDGWLVLADVWYPGWESKVNGQVIEIFKADYLFRGVQVVKGVNVVEFVYRPMSVRLGAAISLFAWVGLYSGWRKWK